MKKSILALPFILLLGFTLTSFANECGTHLCRATIKHLYPHENGNVYVSVNAEMSLLNCTLNQGLFMVLQNDNKRFDEIYAILLASKLTDKTPVIRPATGSTNCRISYVQLENDS